MYTCVRKEVNLEQKNKICGDNTGLMYASSRGHKSIVDLHIEFQVDINL